MTFFLLKKTLPFYPQMNLLFPIF
ncbi:hypothetical protein YPPY03_0977, partial [Yersinia pestis PY-03]